MTSLRHYFLQRRSLALWLVGLALLMRIAVPAGYMPMFSGHSITVELCSGYGPMKMAMSGMASHDGKKSEQGKSEMPCGFSGLSTQALAGADPMLLALAIAFIIATVFLSVPPVQVALPTYLRPPLRGPPTAA